MAGAYSSISAAAGESYKPTGPLPLVRSTPMSRAWLLRIFASVMIVIVLAAVVMSFQEDDDPSNAPTPALTPAELAAARAPLEALFKDIDAAYTGDRFARAAFLCIVLSYTGERDAHADTLCAMVACRQGRATAARRHYRKLADWQREGVLAACTSDGIPLHDP